MPDDATYRLYAEIAPRVSDSFSESAKEQITAAMGPVQRRLDEISRGMGDTAGLEFGTKFRSRVEDAIRSVSGTVRISLDLDTSSVYAKLDAIRADTATGISQKLGIDVSGLSEAQARIDELDTTAEVHVKVDESSVDKAQAQISVIQARSDAALAQTQAKNEATLGQIQAKNDASLGQIQAKSDASLGQIFAKSDAAQAQISAKNDAALGLVAAKGEAVRGQIQAKDDATLGQIQARNDAALEQIRARNDAALAQIQARGSQSSGGGGISPFAAAVGVGVTAASGPAAALALGSLPALFAAVGAAAEKSNTEVSSAFSDMAASAKQTLAQGFAPLVPALAQIATSAKTSLGQLEPVFEQASRSAAPLITTITQGFLQATVVGVGGFAQAMKGIQPIADAIAQGLVGLARAASGFIQALNTTAAAEGLRLLFAAVDSLLPVLAQALNALMPLGNAILGLVPTIGDLIHGALNVLGPVLDGVAAALRAVGQVIDHIATPLGAMGAVILTGVVAFKALDVAAGLASKAVGALGIEVGAAAAPITLVVAAVGGLVYGFEQLVDPAPITTSIDKVTGSITRLGIEIGRIPQDKLRELTNPPPTTNPFWASGGAVAAGPTVSLSTDAQVAADNLLQTDLNNRAQLTQAVTNTTQAYADANYQLGASQRAVEASSRAERTAVEGVADAQHNLAGAVRAVQDAQQKLSDDEVSARAATLALTDARKQAAQALVDLRLQLSDQAASQLSSKISLFDAQQAAKAAGIDVSHGPVGLPTGQVTAQNEAQQKAQLALVQAQNQYNDTLNTGNKLQDTANQAFKAGINGSTQVIAAQQALSQANRQVKADLIAVSDAQYGVVKAQQAVVDARQAVVDAARAHTDALRAEAAQARAVQKAYQDMSDAQDAATISTDLNTQAGRDNYQQAQDLLTADKALGLSSRDLTSKFADQETQLGLTKQQIFDTAAQTGKFTGEQLQDLLSHLDGGNAKTSNLNINLGGTRVRLKDLDGLKVNFDVNGVGSIDLNSLYQSLGYNAGQIKQIQQQAHQPGGPPQGSANALLHASGGPIHGPGGPRDDLVPAWLSNGEHVWTADEVAKAGGHGAIEAMRRSVRGYAFGGAVSAADALAAAGVVAFGMGKATGYDTGIGIASALNNRKPVFAPDHGHTKLSVTAPAVSAAVAGATAGATLVGVIPSGQHKALIDAALKADNIPITQWPQWEIGMSTLIQRESAWRANAINLWDSNAKAGHPSQGLTQTIPGTFAAYRNHSLANNILDPVANIAASINYILARYHSIGNVQQANPALPPKGYALGGAVYGPGGPQDDMVRGWLSNGEHVWSASEVSRAGGHGAVAGLRSGSIRLDTYSIAQLAQAIVVAQGQRPINVQVGQSKGLGVFVS